MKIHRKTVGKRRSKDTRKNCGAKFGMRKTMKGGGMFDFIFGTSDPNAPKKSFFSFFSSTPTTNTTTNTTTTTPVPQNVDKENSSSYFSMFDFFGNNKKKESEEVAVTSFETNPVATNEINKDTTENTGDTKNMTGPPGLSGLTEPSGPTKTGGWMWGGKKRRNKKNKTAKNSGLKKGGGRK